MNAALDIVILAAGQGKRMRSALPKVLHPLAGKPLLAHVIAAARALQPARICIVHGHGGAAVRAAFAGSDLLWAEQSEQLGTGHALLQALPLLAASTAPAAPEKLPADGQGAVPPKVTLVLYGDVPLVSAATLHALLAVAGPDRLALLTAQRAVPHGYGRIVRAAGAVCRIVEEKDASDDERAIREINTGILAAPTDALARWLPALGRGNAQGEYYLTDIVALAVGEGLAVNTASESFAAETDGVNDKRQLAALERLYQRRAADALLDAGVTLADPARFDLRGELRCGADVFIDVGCLFEGAVQLGDGVHVGAHCVLKDCVVDAGARIAPLCHIDGAHIGQDAVVGPYARLRPGTTLGEAAHVGNFVEIKNAQIGAQSKANHLAYVGDASVGARVNIGAGTITCNYDGANKHRTVIEDDVFIGSDSQLVAPVTVRRGATLGAGTTLTRDAPADTLTVSRTRQASVPNWTRPRKSPK